MSWWFSLSLWSSEVSSVFSGFRITWHLLGIYCVLRTVTVTADGTSSRVGWGRQDRTRSGLRTTLSRVQVCLAGTHPCSGDLGTLGCDSLGSLLEGNWGASPTSKVLGAAATLYVLYLPSPDCLLATAGSISELRAVTGWDCCWARGCQRISAGVNPSNE